LTTNPEYGGLVIAQVPENSSFNTIRAICKRHNQKRRVDIIIIDSIDLIGSDRKRREKRDELNEVIMASKGMAMGFDNGRGVPIITPWQIKMSAHMEVLNPESGKLGYDITDFGNSVEIQRKADLAMSILPKKDNTHRALCTLHKWRDGKSESSFDLETNLDRSYIGSTESIVDDNSDDISAMLRLAAPSTDATSISLRASTRSPTRSIVGSVTSRGTWWRSGRRRTKCGTRTARFPTVAPSVTS
jgi:hypothetical protein